ncbi:EF-hand calcium-binding domain-containing protein 5, partial [Trichoplax sp. H2]
MATLTKDETPATKAPALSVFIERQMSEFLKSRVKNAALRWKKAHDKRIQKRLQAVRAERKERLHFEKEDAMELARKVPMDILARDWLNDIGATADIRAYLVEKLLPTLILGIEKLLLEIAKRNLIDAEEPNTTFNPINFVAQYLMRNNPRYSNFSEASPYIRGLRQVAEDLRTQVFSYEDNRLAQIKAEARRKREEREQQERMAQVSSRRRIEALAEHFSEWTESHKPITLRM